MFLPRPENIWQAGAYLLIFSIFGVILFLSTLIDNYNTKRKYPFNLSWWKSIDPLSTFGLLVIAFAWYLFLMKITRGS